VLTHDSTEQDITAHPLRQPCGHAGAMQGLPDDPALLELHRPWLVHGG
jgi:hypothetical protein